MAEQAGHMSLRTWFDKDRQEVAFQIQEGDKAWGHVTVELPEFTDLMGHLAEYRMKFSEPVPRQIDPGTRSEATVSPVWSVTTLTNPPEGVEAGSVLLQIRHPGYGWLSFVVPPKDAMTLSRGLEKSVLG